MRSRRNGRAALLAAERLPERVAAAAFCSRRGIARRRRAVRRPEYRPIAGTEPWPMSPWLRRPINPGCYRLNANVPVPGSLRNYGHCLRTRAAPGWPVRSRDAGPGCVGPQNAGNLLHRANSRPKPRSHARQRHQESIQPFPIADLRRIEVGGHN